MSSASEPIFEVARGAGGQVFVEFEFVLADFNDEALMEL